jgi:hypothetical protein
MKSRNWPHRSQKTEVFEQSIVILSMHILWTRIFLPPVSLTLQEFILPVQSVEEGNYPKLWDSQSIRRSWLVDWHRFGIPSNLCDERDTYGWPHVTEVFVSLPVVFTHSLSIHESDNITWPHAKSRFSIVMSCGQSKISHEDSVEKKVQTEVIYGHT